MPLAASKKKCECCTCPGAFACTYCSETPGSWRIMPEGIQVKTGCIQGDLTSQGASSGFCVGDFSFYEAVTGHSWRYRYGNPNLPMIADVQSVCAWGTNDSFDFGGEGTTVGGDPILAGELFWNDSAIPAACGGSVTGCHTTYSVPSGSGVGYGEALVYILWRLERTSSNEFELVGRMRIGARNKDGPTPPDNIEFFRATATASNCGSELTFVNTYTTADDGELRFLYGGAVTAKPCGSECCDRYFGIDCQPCEMTVEFAGVKLIMDGKCAMRDYAASGSDYFPITTERARLVGDGLDRSYDLGFPSGRLHGANADLDDVPGIIIDGWYDGNTEPTSCQQGTEYNGLTDHEVQVFFLPAASPNGRPRICVLLSVAGGSGAPITNNPLVSTWDDEPGLASFGNVINTRGMGFAGVVFAGIAEIPEDNNLDGIEIPNLLGPIPKPRPISGTDIWPDVGGWESSGAGTYRFLDTKGNPIRPAYPGMPDALHDPQQIGFGGTATLRMVTA